MADVLAHLGAAASILGKVQGRPSFNKVSAMERRRVEVALQQVAPTAHEVQKILDGILSANFAAEDESALIDLASEAVDKAPVQMPAAKTQRSSMQNWESLIHFITPTVWDKLAEGSIDPFLDHLCRLGLRHPSEPTSATMALVCLHQSEGEKLCDVSPAARLQLVKTIKQTFKNKMKTAPPPLVEILSLPSSPAIFESQYPAVYVSVFFGGAAGGEPHHRARIGAVEGPDQDAGCEGKRSHPCAPTAA